MSWQSFLDDTCITIANVNKSLYWLSKSELSQNDIDKKTDFCTENTIQRPTLTP